MQNTEALEQFSHVQFTCQDTLFRDKHRPLYRNAEKSLYRLCDANIRVAVNQADQYVLQRMWKEMAITETSARSPEEIILNTHA